MKEHVAHRSVDAIYYWAEPYVAFKSNGIWYKVPFFVLEEMLQDCFRHEQNTGERPIFRNPLMKWLNSWTTEWQPRSTQELKQILKDEIPGMEAYRLYEPFPHLPTDQ